MTEEISPEENRRREDRALQDGTARVQVLESSSTELQGMTFEADVYDTSVSGLRIECNELLDDCVLLIQVSLTGSGESLSIRGEVRWASFEEDGNFQMGVEFAGNDSALNEQWMNMLASVG